MKKEIQIKNNINTSYIHSLKVFFVLENKLIHKKTCWDADIILGSWIYPYEHYRVLKSRYAEAGQILFPNQVAGFLHDMQELRNTL